jgi:hypothetical protein
MYKRSINSLCLTLGYRLKILFFLHASLLLFWVSSCLELVQVRFAQCARIRCALVLEYALRMHWNTFCSCANTNYSLRQTARVNDHNAFEMHTINTHQYVALCKVISGLFYFLGAFNVYYVHRQVTKRTFKHELQLANLYYFQNSSCLPCFQLSNVVIRSFVIRNSVPVPCTVCYSARDSTYVRFVTIVLVTCELCVRSYLYLSLRWHGHCIACLRKPRACLVSALPECMVRTIFLSCSSVFIFQCRGSVCFWPPG